MPGIIGLNASLEYIRRVGIDTIFETEKQLAQLFIEEIDKLPNVKIIGVRDWNKRVGF